MQEGNTKTATDQEAPEKRRHLLGLLGGVGVLSWFSRARAHHTESHFDDRSAHQVVYQCNQAGEEYLGHILFSAGEMLRLYGNDVEIVIECFGAGLHLLGLRPERQIPKVLQQRAGSLAEYGIAFHACGNTMKSLAWGKEDLVAYAKVVPVGAADLVKLQERGFSYISW